MGPREACLLRVGRLSSFSMKFVFVGIWYSTHCTSREDDLMEIQLQAILSKLNHFNAYHSFGLFPFSPLSFVSLSVGIPPPLPPIYSLYFRIGHNEVRLIICCSSVFLVGVKMHGNLRLQLSLCQHRLPGLHFPNCKRDRIIKYLPDQLMA